MNPDDLADLIKKLLEDRINKSEKAKLTAWIEEHPERRLFIENLQTTDHIFQQTLDWLQLEHSDNGDWENRLSQNTLSKLNADHHRSPSFPNIGRYNRYYLVVASLILLAIVSVLWLTKKTEIDLCHTPLSLEEIKPGRYQAFLISPDGNEQPLSRRHQPDSIVIHADGAVRYTDGKLVAALKPDTPVTEHGWTIRVPKKGYYCVQLPDSSRVWLNADSELEVPHAFGQSNRIVSLSGEGYFQVVSMLVDRHQTPFLVRTNDQVVEVTGTEFNISAFPEDQDTKTTLIQGQVQVHASGQAIELSAGEQSSLSAQGFRKQRVNTASHIAWKNNTFHFDQTPLETAMQQLARWYDVEVKYEDDLPTTAFYGEFSRDQPLDSVLQILEEAGIRFQFNHQSGKNHLTVLSLDQTT